MERYSSEARVDVHIVSASRPIPHFTQPIYTAAVDENAPRGTALLASVTVRRLTVLYCTAVYLGLGLGAACVAPRYWPV